MNNYLCEKCKATITTVFPTEGIVCPKCGGLAIEVTLTKNTDHFDLNLNTKRSKYTDDKRLNFLLSKESEE